MSTDDLTLALSPRNAFDGPLNGNTLASLKSLKRLDVSHNRFTQGLPETLTTLSELRQVGEADSSVLGR